MFVISRQQFESLLGLSPVRKAENLLDIGELRFLLVLTHQICVMKILLFINFETRLSSI